MTQEAARKLVDTAIQRIPNLTPRGVGMSDTKRADMYKDSFLQMVSICAEWVKECKVRKTFNKNHSSYGYKHIVEELRESYISNGAFIAAAVGLGLDFRIVGVNAVFKFAEDKTWDSLRIF